MSLVVATRGRGLVSAAFDEDPAERAWELPSGDLVVELLFGRDVGTGLCGDPDGDITVAHGYLPDRGTVTVTASPSVDPPFADATMTLDGARFVHTEGEGDPLTVDGLVIEGLLAPTGGG